MRRIIWLLTVLTLIVLAACNGLDTPTTSSPASTTSRQTPKITKWLDLNYYGANSPNPAATSLDIYGAENLKGAPVMLFIHGGGWATGDKTTAVKYKPEFFVASGYIFVSINYRLVPEIQFPTNVEDVAKAIAWTSDNISKYGGDPGRIFVSGHSAGAHLATLVTTNENYLQALGKNLSVTKGCIPLDSAAFDINSVMEEARSRGVRNELYEGAFTSNPKIWTEASPITWVSRGRGVPPFLLVYVADRQDSAVNSRNMAEKLRAAGIRAEVFSAANKTHASLNRQLGLEKDPPTEAVVNFLSTVGGNPATAAHYVPVPPEEIISPDRAARAREQAKTFFKRWDTNQDGKLSRGEVPEANRANFADADDDLDGFVTEDELARFLGQ
ncbi:MAG: hypothetical protein FJ009_09530 [Chloroflexi bacterium]|nr:hypothetical protein [Chloroflexota bacterium]